MMGGPGQQGARGPAMPGQRSKLLFLDSRGRRALGPQALVCFENRGQTGIFCQRGVRAAVKSAPHATAL
jgi:hypothetical protein